MKIKLLCLTIALSLLTACGGGGGGGSDSGASSGVRILHAAINAAPVDFYSSTGGSLLQTSRFAFEPKYSSISGGEQLLNLFRTKSTSNLVTSTPINYVGGESYSLLFYGGSNSSLNATLIKNSKPQLAAGQAAVKLVNGLEGSSALALDFAEGEVAYGQGGDYTVIPAGSRSVRVVSDSSSVVASAVHNFLDGKSYTVFVAGEEDYFTSYKILED